MHHSLGIAIGLGGLSWHVASAAGVDSARGLFGASCNSRWPMPTPAGPNAEVKAPKPAAPLPTAGPTAEDLRLELAKRQADENICGYELGDSGTSLLGPGRRLSVLIAWPPAC